MRNFVLKATVGMVILLIVLVLFPIIRLAVTDAKVARSLFTDTYYTKVAAGETDFDVFREYMESRNWSEVDQMGGLHVFEKDGERKLILNTQVKTVFINGRLNFKLRYLFR